VGVADNVGAAVDLPASVSDLFVHSGETRPCAGACGIGALATLGAKAQNAMMTTDPKQPRARRRVLVVDDSPDVADSLALLLKTFGADVRVARSGGEGLAACAEFSPELIFLDISMPGMDGFETARRLRELPTTSRATLVALTGRGEEDMRRRVKQAGFDRHLMKPADLDALASLLDVKSQE
jgi:CheY-like chemotaxis protein